MIKAWLFEGSDIKLTAGAEAGLDVSAQLADDELDTSASYGQHHYHQPDDYHGGHHSQSDHELLS